MEANPLTQIMILVRKDFKKKFKELAVANETTMTEMILDALKEKYKELKDISV
jgi:hypothetical protein